MLWQALWLWIGNFIVLQSVFSISRGVYGGPKSYKFTNYINNYIHIRVASAVIVPVDIFGKHCCCNIGWLLAYHSESSFTMTTQKSNLFTLYEFRELILCLCVLFVFLFLSWLLKYCTFLSYSIMLSSSSTMMSEKERSRSKNMN